MKALVRAGLRRRRGGATTVKFKLILSCPTLMAERFDAASLPSVPGVRAWGLGSDQNGPSTVE